MTGFRLAIEAPDVQRVRDNIAQLPRWMPAIMRTHMKTLRTVAVDAMREAVLENRYTGSLEESIRGEFEDDGKRLIVGPTVKRGRWDGGLILEMGTRPIPKLPFAPIKKWAEFRGLPPFPIWHKIKTEGVSPHPFLDRTMKALEPRIDEAARRMAEDVAEAVVSGRGTESEG